MSQPLNKAAGILDIMMPLHDFKHQGNAAQNSRLVSHKRLLHSASMLYNPNEVRCNHMGQDGGETEQLLAAANEPAESMPGIPLRHPWTHLAGGQEAAEDCIAVWQVGCGTDCCAGLPADANAGHGLA